MHVVCCCANPVCLTDAIAVATSSIAVLLPFVGIVAAYAVVDFLLVRFFSRYNCYFIDI